jgi:Zn-finger nucleic acid-binding protein
MNEEKDRFGDFIRLLERAREDVYFAERDRELLDKLKHRLERAQQGQLENPHLKCPECGVHLHNFTLMDFPVRRCSACGGIWLDRDVLPPLMNLKTLEPSSERRSARDSLRSMWPAWLSGMGKSLGGEKRKPAAGGSPSSGNRIDR